MQSLIESSRASRPETELGAATEAVSLSKEVLQIFPCKTFVSRID